MNDVEQTAIRCSDGPVSRLVASFQVTPLFTDAPGRRGIGKHRARLTHLWARTNWLECRTI